MSYTLKYKPSSDSNIINSSLQEFITLVSATCSYTTLLRVATGIRKKGNTCASFLLSFFLPMINILITKLLIYLLSDCDYNEDTYNKLYLLYCYSL